MFQVVPQVIFHLQEPIPIRSTQLQLLMNIVLMQKLYTLQTVQAALHQEQSAEEMFHGNGNKGEQDDTEISHSDESPGSA